MTASRIADRPADIPDIALGYVYRWDYDLSFKRSLWQIWEDVVYEFPHGFDQVRMTRPCFQGYACRWPDSTFTRLPNLPDDPEIWLAAHTSKPDAL